MFSIVMKQSQTHAKPVGQSLVAVFHAATPPLVWQFDLEKNHSFTLHVQGEDGKWDLGVTVPRGEFVSVARFADRPDADEAFAAVQKALFKPRAHIAGWSGRMRGALLTALFLVIAVGLLSLVFGGSKSPVDNKAVAATAASLPNLLRSAAPVSPAPPAPSIQNGVPQSADDVLKMPR